jgi:hypothetical protein
MFSLPVPENVRRTQFGDLSLLKYTKPLQNPAMGVYRSVVVCGDQVLCVAPPRAMPLADFMATYPFASIRVDDFVDGTMVNVFFKDQWQLCTKSNIGASNGFLEGAPSFAAMFMEAAVAAQLDLDTLDRNCVYSFVLQHPQNRIVTPVKSPALVLVKCYRISGNDVTEESRMLPAPWPVNAESYDQLLAWAKTMPYINKGFMLHAPDGTRAKILGEAYLHVSAIRGSDASLKFRVLQLRDRPELVEFLAYYPEVRVLAADTTASVRRFTNELYSMYLDCFRAKTKPLAEYPREFKPHLYALHQLYLGQWPTPIHKKRVVEYVATLAAAQLCVGIKS